MCVCIYLCAYITRVYITHKHIYMYLCIYMCIYNTYIHMYVCICVYTYIYMYTIHNICVYTHTHTLYIVYNGNDLHNSQHALGALHSAHHATPLQGTPTSVRHMPSPGGGGACPELGAWFAWRREPGPRTADCCPRPPVRNLTNQSPAPTSAM